MYRLAWGVYKTRQRRGYKYWTRKEVQGPVLGPAKEREIFVSNFKWLSGEYDQRMAWMANVAVNGSECVVYG
jgi:hypothetical protein